jgi:polyhydroxybutyrate depolymerase
MSMSSKQVSWTSIELVCSSRKRRTLLFDPRVCLDGETLDTERPLLIAFHGGSGQAEQMEKLTGFMALGGEQNFFVAYPQGINRGWNDGRDLPHRREIDDVEFIVKLVQYLCESFPIDRQRVFACGISNGGFFAQYLAVRAPGLIAAVASVAATVHEPMFNGEPPSEPVAIMFVVGKDDPVVPFCGGDIELARKKAGRVVRFDLGLNYWIAANHADSHCVETVLPLLNDEDGTRVVKRVFSVSETQKLQAKPLVVCIVEGGGHAWPLGWQYYREKFIGKTSTQFETSSEIVRFFLDQTS